MIPVTCPHRNGGLRIVLCPNDRDPGAIMGYAHTMGAVSMREGIVTFHLRGRYGEIADINEETLRSYLDPIGTCQRNNGS